MSLVRRDAAALYETAISAQREHEEKKIPYLANLLATIAFDPHIDVGMANYMVRIASSLTYRQYCILNIAVNVTAWGGIHSPPYNNPENIATQVWTLLLEIYDLFRLQNLIGFGGAFYRGDRDAAQTAAARKLRCLSARGDEAGKNFSSGYGGGGCPIA
jgi:hypothetical protein